MVGLQHHPVRVRRRSRLLVVRREAPTSTSSVFVINFVHPSALSVCLKKSPQLPVPASLTSALVGAVHCAAAAATRSV